MINAPTLLTLTRLIIAPIVIPVLTVYLLPLNNVTMNLAVAALFIVFGITDLLDGYLARLMGKETQLGTLLDFVADKFLVYSSLIGLVAIQKIYFLWPLIFIGRELFIMGIRMRAAELNRPIGVSGWGKIKTCSQLAYIAVVLANPDHGIPLLTSKYNQVEMSLLVISLLLTVYSAYRYFKTFIKTMPTSIVPEHNGQEQVPMQPS